MKFTRSIHMDGKRLNDSEFGDNHRHLPDCAALSPSYGHLRAIQALVSLLLILAASAVYYLWHEAEIGAQLLEGELRMTIAAETWLALPSDDGGDANHLPAHVTSVKVQGITFFGPVASAQVETTYVAPDGRTFLAQQRRFYQPTQSGWVRVTPTRAILGSPQRYDTDFFTFVYYQLDSEAVESITTEADVVYADLRKDYMLPPVAERRDRGTYGCTATLPVWLSPTLSVVHGITGAGLTHSRRDANRGPPALAPERTGLPGRLGCDTDCSIPVWLAGCCLYVAAHADVPAQCALGCMAQRPCALALRH